MWLELLGSGVRLTPGAGIGEDGGWLSEVIVADLLVCGFSDWLQLLEEELEKVAVGVETEPF